DAGQKVTFVQDGTGEYHMSGQLSATLQFDPEVARLMEQTIVALSAAAGSPKGAHAAAARVASGHLVSDGQRYNQQEMYQRGVMTGANDFNAVMGSFEGLFAFGKAELFEKIEPPADAKGRVTITESFGKITLQCRIGLFQGAGGTNTVITMGFPAGEVKL